MSKWTTFTSVGTQSPWYPPPHWYVWHDSWFIYATWHESVICVMLTMRHIDNEQHSHHLRHYPPGIPPHLYVWHDSWFICKTWLVHMCYVDNEWYRHWATFTWFATLFSWYLPFIRVTWFICVTRLIHRCDMLHTRDVTQSFALRRQWAMLTWFTTLLGGCD